MIPERRPTHARCARLTRGSRETASACPRSPAFPALKLCALCLFRARQDAMLTQRRGRDIGENSDNDRNRTHLDLHTDVDVARTGIGHQSLLGPMERSARVRCVAHRQSTARVERKQEHPVEGRNPRPRLGPPIVWGDRVFVLTAAPSGIAGDAQHAPRGSLTPRGVHRFVVMALDRKTGKTIWERVAREQEPHERSHVDNGTWALVHPSTASACSPTSSPLACMRMTSTACCSGRKTSVTSACEISLAKARRQPSMAHAGRGLGPHRRRMFIVALDKRDGKDVARAAQEIDTGHALFWR